MSKNKNAKVKRTCREELESKGVRIFDMVPGEFVAYKPDVDGDYGVVDMDFPLEAFLNELGFFDYDEVSAGRACYVMGDVNQPV